jgi:cellulose synthase/poly-beta-1,6-N-acetylglucosamine synthase-like glycosyltransferase
MGPARAKNIGAREAKANILCFIDADVKVGSDTLLKITEKFSDPDITAVQTMYSKIAPVKNFFSEYQTLYQHYNFNVIRSKYLCTLSSYAMAIRKDIFFKVGGFDEAIKRASVEDEHLGAALYSQGYNILLAKDIEVEHLVYFNIGKLLKRMFIMGEDNIKYFAVRSGLKRMNPLKTHHSLNLMASMLIAPSILFFLPIAVALPVTRILTVVLASLFLIINSDFFIFIYKNKGTVFTLKSVIIYYLVAIASFLGCIKGAVDKLIK